ncbi:MAG: hypothetical protein HZC41_03455 [Chloroflexi bacterium]|nr:hypothetical protein [Chloroflexota bacterium]
MRRWYPVLVGLLLGLLQTGLFFQLTFTLSSSIGTFLLVTVCWLAGSALGVALLARWPLPTWVFLVVALLAYGIVGAALLAQPFNTALWPVYAGLIVLTGLYAGVFFARMSRLYRARDLFLRENNGFILGIVVATLLFLLVGRPALWWLPPLAAGVLLALREPKVSSL